MTDILIIVVIAVILGGAVWYIRRSRKRGATCIGCPDAKSCAAGGGCGSCAGCQNTAE